MIIETDQWLGVGEFAKKVGKYSAYITHYLEKHGMQTVKIGRYTFIHEDEVKKWPPEPKPLGRPIK